MHPTCLNLGASGNCAFVDAYDLGSYYVMYALEEKLCLTIVVVLQLNANNGCGIENVIEN